MLEGLRYQQLSTCFALRQRRSRSAFPLRPPFMRRVIVSNADCVFLSARALSPCLFQYQMATSKQYGCCATSAGSASNGWCNSYIRTSIITRIQSSVVIAMSSLSRRNTSATGPGPHSKIGLLRRESGLSSNFENFKHLNLVLSNVKSFAGICGYCISTQ